MTPNGKKQAGAAVGLWCQNTRYRRVIKIAKFINIQTSKTCKIRGILAKLDAFMKDPVSIVFSESMKSKKKNKLSKKEELFCCYAYKLYKE